MKVALVTLALCAAAFVTPLGAAGPTDCGGAVDVGCDVCNGYAYRPGEPRECVSKTSCTLYVRELSTSEYWLCASPAA